MKIALITGGSRGLGKSAALHAAKRGLGIVFTYHTNKKAADEVAHEIESGGGKAIALQLDVSQSKTFTGFAEELKAVLKKKWNVEKFDHLVNNAGTGARLPIAEASEEQFEALYNIHLKGPFFLTQKLLPLMNDNGSILNISSGLARFSLPGYAPYAMMKGGIEVLSRYLAKEYGERGIRSNTLAPGAIETDFGGGHTRDNPEVNKMVASVTSLGRAGVPDDIGPLIASMLSEDARWVNAQRIEASGGMFS